MKPVWRSFALVLAVLGSAASQPPQQPPEEIVIFDDWSSIATRRKFAVSNRIVLDMRKKDRQIAQLMKSKGVPFTTNDGICYVATFASYVLSGFETVGAIVDPASGQWRVVAHKHGGQGFVEFRCVALF